MDRVGDDGDAAVRTADEDADEDEEDEEEEEEEDVPWIEGRAESEWRLS